MLWCCLTIPSSGLAYGQPLKSKVRLRGIRPMQRAQRGQNFAACNRRVCNVFPGRQYFCGQLTNGSSTPAACNQRPAQGGNSCKVSGVLTVACPGCPSSGGQLTIAECSGLRTRRSSAAIPSRPVARAGQLGRSSPRHQQCSMQPLCLRHGSSGRAKSRPHQPVASSWSVAAGFRQAAQPKLQRLPSVCKR